MGVNPNDVGHFKVILSRRKTDYTTQIYGGPASPQTDIWNAKKVDQVNFKKHGITNAIG